MTARNPAPAWYVISLRPRGGNASLRRAAARHGAGLLALAPWKLETIDSAESRAALDRALAADRLMFTSPQAARSAATLCALRARAGQDWFAVGAGTAAALRRAGIPVVASPARMDSEGLLALPGLQQLQGSTIGLVTAPGGRGTLPPALAARGAEVIRANVYRRVPVLPPPRALAAVRDLDAPAVLAVSSGEALQLALQSLPAPVLERLLGLPVVAASERLVQLARASGFSDCRPARSARPADMAEAAAQLMA
ncbi:uroporphyrinogen-III synthase [Lysobacter sp. H21R4]|uniref:uroporphyrinogen-III synthase n=1 Tax=Lysobacter sp. H21R4 TaxID=2781021 RepID=UPI001886FAE3|nr:uroporphyrinogen-III synthase [Lysobacter sp. H21R4]QOY62833.1 uroporphyrinogen-III synthase [Lysobacter sp. H21R4]